MCVIGFLGGETLFFISQIWPEARKRRVAASIARHELFALQAFQRLMSAHHSYVCTYISTSSCSMNGHLDFKLLNECQPLQRGVRNASMLGMGFDILARQHGGCVSQ